tara:strand:+ start:147 stop:440 length:294 start_codon:yes stop_codon:yes gene_type:complete
MSDGVSIKVNIAGKEYPLKVSLSDQKDVISVEQEIKESLELLKTNYGVKDKQDLLAMFLFQYMMANKKSNNDLGGADDGLHDKLKDLEEFVSNYLKS